MKTRKTSSWQVFWLVAVILVLLAALVLGYLITFQKSDSMILLNGGASNSIPLENYGPAPDFRLPDLQGNDVILSELQGKVVLVDFWGTWCKSCCDEMPGMDRVYRKYKDEGFELVAIAIEFTRDPEERLQKVKRKVDELGVTFAIVIGDDSVVQSFGGKLENFPQTYLIDRDGHVRKKIVGARKEEYWESLVQSALSE